jgi:hypothetical protein
MHEGRLDEGLQLASTGQVGNRSGWYEDDRHWFYDAYVWALDAELAVLNAAPDAAVRLERATPVGQENRWAAACLDRAQWRLTGETELLHRSVAGWEAIDARFERACTLLLLPDRADEGRAELSAMGASLPR